MKRIAAGWLALGLMSSAALAAVPSPVGDWRTFDDHTGLERSLVRIEDRGGVLVGTIIKTTDPKSATKVCEKCEDDRKGRPIIGLEIMRDMRKDGDEWDGGHALDPETGGIYKAEMHLEDGGAKLVLRGYIGISLFGRSQTWIRATP